MSDHPREAQRHLKKINVCDDVWFSTFEFIERTELGLKLAPISVRFCALVETHFKSRKWKLCMGIIQKCDDAGGPNMCTFVDGLLREKPFLQTPPPNNLIGFRRIRLSYIDQQVLTFLDHIRHLFNAAIFLDLSIHPEHEIWGTIAEKIWPLLAGNISTLYRLFDTDLTYLRFLVSPSVLRDCANLRVIYCNDLFPEAMADDHANASNKQALSMWLHTPRGDGQPKVLTCFEPMKKDVAWKVEEIKKSFINATTSVPFIVVIQSYGSSFYQFDGKPFEVENGRTFERLTLKRIKKRPKRVQHYLWMWRRSKRYNRGPSKSAYYRLWLLRRGPIAWDEKRWAQLEKEAIKSRLWPKDNVFRLDFRLKETAENKVWLY
uniref:Uncharacterized protein n=1 Tax=Globodera rostochiensis TaxID=31243 RepID=A0A914HL68_GLORO